MAMIIMAIIVAINDNDDNGDCDNGNNSGNK